MKKHLLRGCVVSVLIALQSAAGTFSLNSVKGLWQFNGNLDPYWECQSAAVASGFTIDGAPGSAYGSIGHMIWLDLRSDDPPYGGLGPDEKLLVPHAAAPNGPLNATRVNSWTIVMDVRIPAKDGAIALLQSTQADDASEIFLDAGRRIVLAGAYRPPDIENPVASDLIPADTWVRLAFTSTFSTHAGLERNTIRVYVNGVITTQSAGGELMAPADGRYGLGPVFSLFSDALGGNTAPIAIGSLAFWGQALSAADIAAIGTTMPAGISWPEMTVQDGWPPLPPLNGKLMFGSFEANFTPDMEALATTAQPSGEAGAVANVTIELGEAGGTILGRPDYTFGDSVEAAVLTNGTAVSLEIVYLNYEDATVDAVQDELMDVLYTRSRVKLSPGVGATSGIQVLLPAGLGVSAYSGSALLHAQANLYEVPLDQTLAPAAEVELTGTSLGFDADGMTFPVLDRIPVRFSTNRLYWDPSAGTFSFFQTWDPPPFYTRSPQLAIAAVQQGLGLPGAAVIPPSNDGYFIAAGVPINAPIVIMARPEGAALLKDLTVSLNPIIPGVTNGFATHYPIMSVRWSGEDSQIRFTDDAIDRNWSWLRGADTSQTSYRRAPLVTSELCSGQAASVPDDPIYFSPGEGMWFFTPDGGLQAWGPVGSTPELELMVHPFTPEWGGFVDTNNAVRFAHRISADELGVGGFHSASVMSGGTAVRNDENKVDDLPQDQRVAAVLLTGFDEFDANYQIERPLSHGYYQGLADYPGINLRSREGPKPHLAKSIISGATVEPAEGYALAEEAKYCIRPGGVNGLHIADANSGNITFEAYGTDIALTRMILSYRDGLNVESGVGGGLYVRDPAHFTLIFQRMKLGPKGELASAEIAPGQAPTLEAWELQFTPLTLDFPQPTGCPPPQPSDGFIRIGASAKLPGLADREFTGYLGIMDGNLVTETLPEVNGNPVAKGTSPISRFEAGSLLQMAGTAQTGDQPWNINPVTGISLNRWVDADSVGTLTVGGLLDVPFFVDMPVVLSTGSKNTQEDNDKPPELYVRSNENWDPLNSAVFDPAHLGYPALTTLDGYRLLAVHDPVATRDWQDLISFSLPVKMEADRVIRSRTPVAEQPLMIFDLTEAVRSMTPDSAEITLDGLSTDEMSALAKQVNVASLLCNSELPGALPTTQYAMFGALTCVRRLDDLLADHSHPLLDAGLETVVTQMVTTAIFAALGQAPDKSSELDTLVGDSYEGLAFQISQLLTENDENPAFGQWRRDIFQPVEDALAGMNSAKGLVDSSGMVDLAAAVASRMGLQSLGDIASYEARLNAAKILMCQTVSRLEEVQAALEENGHLTTALKIELGDVDGIRMIVQQAVDDLKPRWAPADPAEAAALYKAAGAQEAFQAELAAALADRFAGSAFAGACGTLLRQYLCDPQTLARQALDDTLRMACQLVADANQPDVSINARGDLGDYLKAKHLRGYARICGDSLHELRLDGELTLQAHDLMPKQKFDGWCLMRDVDSGTPGTDHIPEGGITAEILAGATTGFEWGSQHAEMTLGAKIGLNAAGDPVSFMGDMAIDGRIDLCAITVNTLKLGVGIGPADAYFYGRTAGRMGDMKVAVGVFFGKTQDIEILKIADRDFGSVLSTMGLDMPVTGALAYGEGDMSLLPLIGIPPSCLLDLRVGGGQGFCALLDDNSSLIAGFKIAESVTGELLCICNVTGRFGSVLTGVANFDLGDPEVSTKYLYTFEKISGRAWTTLEGEVGYDPFSYTFSKTLGLTLSINQDGDIKWDVDY